MRCLVSSPSTANVIVPLMEFDSGELVDKWYTLSPHGGLRGDGGTTVRLRTRYIHQVIMPIEQYTSLKDVSNTYREELR